MDLPKSLAFHLQLIANTCWRWCSWQLGPRHTERHCRPILSISIVGCYFDLTLFLRADVSARV